MRYRVPLNRVSRFINIGNKQAEAEKSENLFLPQSCQARGANRVMAAAGRCDSESDSLVGLPTSQYFKLGSSTSVYLAYAILLCLYLAATSANYIFRNIVYLIYANSILLRRWLLENV